MTRRRDPLSDVERRLLRLIWGGDPSAPDLSAPDAVDLWRALDALASRHRLRPLLHDRLRSAAGVPVEIGREWTAAHRRATVRAMRQRATAVRIARLLAPEDTPALLLKGGALVWRGWIDPALRPMRDLDLLVTEEAAPRLHARLVSAGFLVVPGPASIKHLPTLRDPVTACHLEIHRRLLDVRSKVDLAGEAVLREAVFGSGEPFLPGGLAVSGPTETLLHLILHSAADHQFNNGPLLLLDIALLVDRGGVDWTRFWRLARECRAERSCRLALRVAERHAGVSGIEWERVSSMPPDRVVDAAVALMLVATEEAGGVGWLGRSLAQHRRRRTDRGSIEAMFDQGASMAQGGMSVRDAARHLALALVRRSGRRHLGRMISVTRWMDGR